MPTITLSDKAKDQLHLELHMEIPVLSLGILGLPKPLQDEVLAHHFKRDGINYTEKAVFTLLLLLEASED